MVALTNPKRHSDTPSTCAQTNTARILILFYDKSGLKNRLRLVRGTHWESWRVDEFGLFSAVDKHEFFSLLRSVFMMNIMQTPMC